MADIVIIGAGPTGLSAAYHLEQKGFFDYKIFDKENNVGGLCRSVQQDGFTFDFTGHLLHINDEYFKNFINSIVGIDNLNKIYRKSFIYSQDTYTHYPYQVNLHGLPIDTIVECIEEFIKRNQHKKVTNFYDWVLKNFGQGFAKNFFLPYQEKIFSYDVKKLSASWTGRFVPQTTLKDMIIGAIKAPEENNFGYNSQFYYPKEGGINFWLNKIAEKLVNPIHTGFCVEHVDTINKVVKFTNGAEEPYKELVTTMPLDLLLENGRYSSRINFHNISQNLLCNSVINFNIGINRPNLSDKHWIYYPEKKYPFYRVGFWNNFAQSMAPKGCSSLYGEFSYLKKSKSHINKKLELSKSIILDLLKISKEEVLTEKVMNIPHAYVIYNNWRDKNIEKILSVLKDMQIHSVGRYGQWKYSSMQEAILDGKKIADSLVVQPAKQIEGDQMILTKIKSYESENIK